MRQSLSYSLLISTIRIETGLNAYNYEFCFQKRRSFIIKNLNLMTSDHVLKYDVTVEMSCLTSQVTKKDFWILFPKTKAGNIPKICKYGIFSKLLNSFLSNIWFNDVN